MSDEMDTELNIGRFLFFTRPVFIKEVSFLLFTVFGILNSPVVFFLLYILQHRLFLRSQGVICCYSLPFELSMLRIEPPNHLGQH
mmetsp:Transcript_26316/g.54241  ORF Transcript_26316/g.54241 Transcript_26316/m.54241 type:complete len:85 (+) Transcript_26316:214-468(+)